MAMSDRMKRVAVNEQEPGKELKILWKYAWDMIMRELLKKH